MRSIHTLLLAPLLLGWVNNCRAWMQNRTGPGLMKPYRTLHKLFHKDAVLAEMGGADGITVHLRSDRRHIQDRDVEIRKVTVHHAHLQGRPGPCGGGRAVKCGADKVLLSRK